MVGTPLPHLRLRNIADEDTKDKDHRGVGGSLQGNIWTKHSGCNYELIIMTVNSRNCGNIYKICATQV